MFIESLTLENFRCFDAGRFVFRGPRTVISGENGRGKTNLLESIFFLAAGKSGRGAVEREIVRHGTEHFDIRSTIRRGSGCVLIRITYDRISGKRAYINGCPLPRLSDLLGTFNAILFSPEDVDLVLKYPHERRRMLDILASQASNTHLADLLVYQRILAHRNRLLRNGAFPGGADPQIEAWDEQLASTGARIVQYRMEAVGRISAHAGGFYQSLSGDGEELRVAYASCAAADRIEETKALLLEGLRGVREREQQLGYTLTGPHRDRVLFEIDGRDARQHASQGQRKSALLSWKLAEAVYLRSVVSEMPVLLLDDVFSELDAKRATRLSELLEGFDQVILTTAREPDLPMSGYERICV